MTTTSGQHFNTNAGELLIHIYHKKLKTKRFRSDRVHLSSCLCRTHFEFSTVSMRLQVVSFGSVSLERLIGGAQPDKLSQRMTNHIQQSTYSGPQ